MKLFYRKLIGLLVLLFFSNLINAQDNGLEGWNSIGISNVFFDFCLMLLIRVALLVEYLHLWFLGAFIIDGYSSAGTILAGKLFGQKSYDMLLKLSKKLILIGVVIGLILLIIGLLFYDNFGYVFSSDRLVVDKFSEVFWIVLLMQPLCAIAFIFDGIFKGLGWMKELRNVLLFSTFIIFIPTIIIADFYNLKIVGIFIAFTVWVIARGAPLVIKFYKRCVALEQKM